MEHRVSEAPTNPHAAAEEQRFDVAGPLVALLDRGPWLLR